MSEIDFKKRYSYNPKDDKLGEGGFGSVFKAYDNFRDRSVALKIAKVNPEFESVRLSKEVEMVTRLDIHPNIAYYEECYTFMQSDGEYDFGILQYYEEGNLLQVLRKGNLTSEQKYSILKQLLDGLQFLHNNGIIHRDLKPQNILIVKRGDEYIPKITDFGISKKLDIDKSSFFSNSLMGAGTLNYSSPEQLKSNKIKKNTDLWSFGIIAFQVLTNKLPFNTGDHVATSELGRQELIRQINNGIIDNSINNIVEPWQTIIRKCLVTDPNLRLTNAEACFALLMPPTDDGTTIDTNTGGTTTTRKETETSSNNEEATTIIYKTSKVWMFVAVGSLVLALFFGFKFFTTTNPVTDQTERIDYLEQQNALLVEQITKSKNEITTAETEIDSLKKQLKASSSGNNSAQLAEKDKKIKELERQVTNLKASVAEKEKEVKVLKSLM